MYLSLCKMTRDCYMVMHVMLCDSLCFFNAPWRQLGPEAVCFHIVHPSCSHECSAPVVEWGSFKFSTNIHVNLRMNWWMKTVITQNAFLVITQEFTLLKNFTQVVNIICNPESTLCFILSLLLSCRVSSQRQKICPRPQEEYLSPPAGRWLPIL